MSPEKLRSISSIKELDAARAKIGKEIRRSWAAVEKDLSRSRKMFTPVHLLRCAVAALRYRLFGQ